MPRLFSDGSESCLTKPQNCGEQAGWVWRAYKKPFNYVCLVRLKARVESDATTCALLRNTIGWVNMDSWKEKKHLYTTSKKVSPRVIFREK